METWRKIVLGVLASLLLLVGLCSAIFGEDAQLALGITGALIWICIIVLALGDELFETRKTSNRTLHNVLTFLSMFEKEAESLGSCRYENSYYEIQRDANGRRYIDTSEGTRYLDDRDGIFHDFHGNNTYNSDGRKID